jgi:hypothetical protein
MLTFYTVSKHMEMESKKQEGIEINEKSAGQKT